MQIVIIFDEDVVLFLVEEFFYFLDRSGTKLSVASADAGPPFASESKDTVSTRPDWHIASSIRRKIVKICIIYTPHKV